VTVVGGKPSVRPPPVEEVVTIVPGETMPTPSPMPELALAPRQPPVPTPTPTPFRAARSLPPLTLKPSPAPTPPPTTQPAGAGPTKAFVSGRSRVTSSREVKGGPRAFDPSGTAVKHAAQLTARLEFETTPAAPRPGDRYSIKIFLDNYGEQRISLKSMSVITVASGARSGGPASLLARSVGAGERALLHEVSGVWKSGESSWALRVEVTNEQNDVCRNSLMWE
jgi:hypothetical protein